MNTQQRKIGSKLTTNFICLALLLVIPKSAIAQSGGQKNSNKPSQATNEKLTDLENRLFGHPYIQITPDSSPDTRLRILEKYVFGEVKPGSIDERLGKLLAATTQITPDQDPSRELSTPVNKPSPVMDIKDPGLYPGRYVYLDAPSFKSGSPFGTDAAPETIPETMFVTNGKISWQASARQLFPGQYLYLGTSSLPATKRFTIDGSDPLLSPGIPIDGEDSIHESSRDRLSDGRYEYLGNTSSNTKKQPLPVEFIVNQGLLCWANPFLLPGRYLYTGGSKDSQSKLLVIQPVNGRRYRITEANGAKENLAFELDEQGNTKWIDASTVPRAKKLAKSQSKTIGQGLGSPFKTIGQGLLMAGEFWGGMTGGGTACNNGPGLPQFINTPAGTYTVTDMGMGITNVVPPLAPMRPLF